MPFRQLTVLLNLCSLNDSNMTPKKLFRWLHRSYNEKLSSTWKTWLWLQHAGVPHEKDIHIFGKLDGINGSILDLGANAAIFANSLFQVNSSMRVHSWEPNKKMRPYLAATKLLHPLRFSYRLLAAGVEAEYIDLHIPVTPDSDMSPSGSLDPHEFEKDYVQERLLQESGQHQGYQFIQQRVKVVPVDDYQLNPVAIKIDVEGFELQALQGLRITLERCHPLLMIENNNADRWFGLLKELGYELYSYDHEKQRLSIIERYCPTLNVIGLHAAAPQSVLDRLQPLIAAGQ